MFDSKRIARDIKSRGAKKILLQVPEGLKTHALTWVKDFEAVGIEVLISCDVCYGSCDIRDHEASQLGCDLILHIGHSDFGLKTEIPVIYEEYRIGSDPKPILEKNLDLLKPYKKISLLTTLQYIPALKSAKKFLEARDKNVFLGSPTKAKYPGQILGCDVSAAKALENLVDCFLFLGTGRFHALGILLKVKKPVLFLNFDTGKLTELKERKKLQMKRLAQVEQAKGLKNFGILLSTKPGQLRTKTAEDVKRKLEKLGKNAWILVMDEIEPTKILGMEIDCLVNCACPRLTEDTERFEKPILDPEDIDKLKLKKAKKSYE